MLFLQHILLRRFFFSIFLIETLRRTSTRCKTFSLLFYVSVPHVQRFQPKRNGYFWYDGNVIFSSLSKEFNQRNQCGGLKWEKIEKKGTFTWFNQNNSSSVEEFEALSLVNSTTDNWFAARKCHRYAYK